MKITNIKDCSRCGGDHAELQAEKLAQPFAPPECAPVAWTHWAPCPTNGQPILVMTTDDSKEHDAIKSGAQHLDDALPIVYQVFSERRAAAAREDGRSGSTHDEEVAAFVSTVREFYAKWRPAPSISVGARFNVTLPPAPARVEVAAGAFDRRPMPAGDKIDGTKDFDLDVPLRRRVEDLPRDSFRAGFDVAPIVDSPTVDDDPDRCGICGRALGNGFACGPECE